MEERADHGPYRGAEDSDPVMEEQRPEDDPAVVEEWRKTVEEESLPTYEDLAEDDRGVAKMSGVTHITRNRSV